MLLLHMLATSVGPLPQAEPSLSSGHSQALSSPDIVMTSQPVNSHLFDGDSHDVYLSLDLFSSLLGKTKIQFWWIIHKGYLQLQLM
jgi:hypothetical protein